MSLLSSLQAKLIGGFVAVVLTALGVSGAFFVFATRHEQEQNEINRVAAASPSVLGEFSAGVVRGKADYEVFARTAAQNHDVRVLFVDNAGVVIEDSGATLKGKTIGPIPTARIGQFLGQGQAAGQLQGQGQGSRRGGAPPSPEANQPTDGIPPTPGAERPAFQGGGRPGQGGDNFRDRVWRPEATNPAHGLVLITSGLPGVRFAEGPGGRTVPAFTQEGISLLLAVPEDTLGRAWLSVLPTLGLAALLALPVAILLAVLLARYITRPLQQLTFASQRMADGAFDIDVPTNRGDELGRLSQSFATMATRVGESQAQMRALVANVSHDLKTPLTSILGFSRAIQTGASGDAPDTQRLGGIIHEEAERLATRLNDLTLLSELDAGQALLDRDAIDLGRMVRSVAGRLLSGDARLTLAVAEDVVVSADPSKLERAIENLVGNASKYAPVDGAIAITVARDRNGATMSIKNPAPGLDPAEVALLFERFYRRDRARAATNGSGLGLSIAREIVELHGGRLEAAAADGSITFSMWLPAERPRSL